MSSLSSPATAQAQPNRPQRYTLPAGSGAIWLGLGPVAVAGLAVTLLLCVMLMLSGAPLWPILLVAATGAAATTWPVAGRTSMQWLPMVTGLVRRRLLGTDRWQQPLHELGSAADLTASASVAGAADRGSRTKPVVLLRTPAARRVRLINAGEDPALLFDGGRGTATVVLATTAAGRFGLLDPDGQDSELDRWSSSLAALLGLPSLRHLQWIVHTGPDTAASPPVGAGRLEQDQAALTTAVRRQARTHLHLFALTVTAADAGSRRGTRKSHSADVAHAVAREASAALLASDILSYPLTARELPAVLRGLTDPSHPAPVVGEELVDVPVAALSGRQAWMHCQLDDTVHRGYAVTGWPRTALPADWLAGLLHHPVSDGSSRTVSVQARPVAPEHAARRARAAAAKARLDSADRQRLGFSPAAGGGLDELEAEQTGAELVAGYRMAELTALVTLHAPALASLDAAAAGLRTAAVSQRLDLRPLHGQHMHALAVGLPLGLHVGGQR